MNDHQTTPPGHDDPNLRAAEALLAARGSGPGVDADRRARILAAAAAAAAAPPAPVVVAQATPPGRRPAPMGLVAVAALAAALAVAMLLPRGDELPGVATATAPGERLLPLDPATGADAADALRLLDEADALLARARARLDDLNPAPQDPANPATDALLARTVRLRRDIDTPILQAILKEQNS